MARRWASTEPNLRAADLLLVPTPSATRLRQIVKLCKSPGFAIRSMPYAQQMLETSPNQAQFARDTLIRCIRACFDSRQA
jgi:hypothetical protein